MADNAKPVPTDLLSLLFNLKEPVYYPKKDGRIFILPHESYYLDNSHRTKAEDIKNKASAKDLIAVKSLSNRILTSNDPRNAASLKRTAPFSIFIHSAHASAFINYLMGLHKWEDKLSAGVYWRDRLNPELFVYCLSTVLLHNSVTSTLRIPPLVKIFPEKVICHDQLSPDQHDNVTPKLPADYIIPKNCTANDDDPEHALSYFREDLALNEHHNHWHVVYPFSGNKDIVNKDRRGEQFYYMHHQMVARYNFERLCNGLECAKPLLIKDSQIAIQEPYFSKLSQVVSSYNYPGRPSGLILKDIKRPKDNVVMTLDKMRQWAKSIEDAIDKRVCINEKKEEIKLNNKEGIDVLGNMVESSILSPDRQVYGCLHNNGHVIISLVHDPDGSQRESFAVMADQTTSIRDPVFYRWHTYLDQIFGRHKSLLDKYKETELKFDSVLIEAVDVINEGIFPPDPCQPDRTELTNQIQTFREWRCIEVPYKLDFHSTNSTSKIAFNQLQHEEFTYRIKVSNKGKEKVVGTCRIFMAPSALSDLTESKFNDIINSWIEMDKFSVELEPGSHPIIRKSVDSSVTIPFVQTFDVDSNAGTIDAKYCGCGWPQNLLVPKGTSEGFKATLFVMISNDKLEKVPVEEMKPGNDRTEKRSQNDEANCKEASSYCGLKGKKYPDTRAMGFPFDRTSDFKNFKSSNMIFQEITIKFDKSKEPNNC